MTSAFTALLLGPMLVAVAAEPVDYARQVKPILTERCYACHGALKQEAGLRLDTAAAVRQGGESGAAVEPADPAASLLLARIMDPDPATRMPPAEEGAPLEAEQIERIRAWIEQGATGPADEVPETDPEQHWAFQAPTRPPVPAVQTPDWVRNPIDAFIAAGREQHGLAAQPAADKHRLLRRVYLDLIGIPPTLAELEAFAGDDSLGAYDRVVERLLESPQYGERWGRHWMDIWRYSDWWGLGAEVRNSQKHIWHWRDWIIESLNTDVGYDEMLRQMLAADELYPNDLERLRATGFLARHYFKFNRNTWLDETVEHTAKAFLGLTLNCTKCHDHKYDPFAQQDYYRFRAFFEPYQIRTDQVPGTADYESDGIARVFDCHLDAPTYLFVRGDEKRPATDTPLEPGVPGVLQFGELTIEPVALPPEAYQPGLRPWVLENHLQLAQRDIEAAQSAYSQAMKTLAEAEASAQASATGAADAAMLAASVSAAQHALAVADKKLAAAQLQPEVLRARAAADRAQVEPPEGSRLAELKQTAAQAERRAAVATANVAVAQAEQALAHVEMAKKAEAEQQLASAREALARAEQAAAEASEAYTPLAGALKTLESPTETEEQRRQPFPKTSTGRRTALARWITDRRNPLTARVAVNHLWGRHFNVPLVPTVFDFGRKGLAPSHPELLDWLAVEFMENGWSMKHVHRLIVTSNTYRMTSSARGAEAQHAADPENRWYWRMNPTRMEAQVVRDSLLALAQSLDLARGGPSIPSAAEQFSLRRSLYFVHSHNEHHRLLEVFDDARVLECYRREQSIVPQQALALANSRQALESAQRITKQLEAERHTATDEQFIEKAFLLVLANLPSAEERQLCHKALREWIATTSEGTVEEKQRAARVSLVHALLNHNDFITIR